MQSAKILFTLPLQLREHFVGEFLRARFVYVKVHHAVIRVQDNGVHHGVLTTF